MPSQLWTKTIQTVAFNESALPKVGRQFLQRTRFVASARRASQNHFVDISAENIDCRVGETLLHRLVPKDAETIGLLTRSAAGAPAANDAIAARHSAASQFGQNDIFEGLEDFVVSIEAGDRNSAKFVEPAPFFGMIFEIALIGP